MKMLRQKKLLILLLIVLSLCLTACDDADAELAIDLAIEWAFEKGLVVCETPSDDPATCVIKTTPALNSYIGGEVVEEVRLTSLIDFPGTGWARRTGRRSGQIE